GQRDVGVAGARRAREPREQLLEARARDRGVAGAQVRDRGPVGRVLADAVVAARAIELARRRRRVVRAQRGPARLEAGGRIARRRAGRGARGGAAGFAGGADHISPADTITVRPCATSSTDPANTDTRSITPPCATVASRAPRTCSATLPATTSIGAPAVASIAT